ncbi:hypothetical protein J2X97_002509 [Epilithonimonas hungarica]|uniref:type VI-B CRISPR-associated RNA-guided ribonuclease Cas13b n=1 Tax=Epilithonimonas hungarica TaxID=454006 RepID=UPI00278951B6|nr:type VI-B CRISPR-associated RNA-guided ribonuclease Cas13b [Epilithonimonas hungarica]MDP9956850.1 hypothetical protein [Epilithonimonas hungarica]
METKQLGSNIYYDHTKKDDKHFFGGFLNLAQNNIDAFLQVFAEKFNNNKFVGSKDFLDSSLKDKLSDAEFQNRIDFLKFHFPVIRFIQLSSNNDRSMLKSKIILLFDAIDKLRNFYTHYYHAPLTLPDELYQIIDNILLNVAIDVKQNKMKDDKTRHLLSKNLSEELEIHYQKNLDNLKKIKLEGKKVNLNDKEGIKNGVLNNAFNHLIYKKDDKQYVSFNYQSKNRENEETENGITISQSGLFFLLSMFLNKKEMEDLKSKAKGFKGKIIKEGEENISSLKFMATHWVFSYLTFKGTKQRLTTDYNKETLLVQIIDELSKVPDEVYKTFDKETQNKFIEDINEYLKEGKEDLPLEESKVVHPVIRKRYENKFNYFAIRFLDEFVNFNTLRFQIHLGNFVHDRRIKNINGTDFETERLVKERIKVFGRLSNISELKKDFIENKLEKNNNTGWEIFPNPSYNFIENNIPIYVGIDKIKNELNDIKKERINQKPEERKRRKEGKTQKYQITQMIAGKSEINYEEPVALFSLNEIPALLYEVLVKQTTPDEIERKIVQKLEERLVTIKNYDPKQPLPASQISKRLKYNDNSQNIDTNIILHLLSKELKETNDKLNLIDFHRAEYNKKVKGKFIRKFIFTNSELGKEATWLSQDIKKFMPEEVRKNWKGYEHSQLQQSLAFYEKRPNEAFNLLKSVWDFNNENHTWNKWIKSSFVNKFFDRFYESYLRGKKRYLSELIENISQHLDNKKSLNKFIKQQTPKDFLEKRFYTYESLEIEKTKILSKPFVFPRGIFDEKPTFIKGKKINENPELFAEWYQYSYNNNHEYQKFYDWERNYIDLLTEESQKDEDFKNNKKKLNKTEQMNLLMMKQDLLIKKVKTQDLFLKLIAERLFEKVFNHSINISLEHVYISQEERIEKEIIALAQSERKEGDTSPNIINDNFIWSKTIPFERKQIFEPAVKLKDIGKFKHFLLDQKINRILSYDETKIWNKNNLENEISIGRNSFESIRREDLFKEIQQLEKDILQTYNSNYNHPLELEFKGNPQFKTYIVNGILRKNKDCFKGDEDDWLYNLNDKDFDNLTIEELSEKSKSIQIAFLLIMIRNKFAHNQLPAKQFYNLINQKFPNIKKETISMLYLDFVKIAKDDLIKILN